MAKVERVVLTNMCMVYQGDKILVQERVDTHWSGICFPGGHVEEGESFVESVKREVFEETGLEIVAPMLCGVKQWTQRNGEYRYIVFFYKTNQFKGEIKDSKEGRVFWIDRKDLKNFTLADGFESMIEVFEREDLSENYHWFEEGVWKVENK